MEQQEKEIMEGLILRSQGGFYQVLTQEAGELQCRGRGRFRKEDTQLVVGDRVQVAPTQEGCGFITGLLPRKNSLIRPPVANIDRLALVVSSTQPAPNLLVIDKLTAIAARRGSNNAPADHIAYQHEDRSKRITTIRVERSRHSQ